MAAGVTGAAALSAWLATRAARADRVHAVEEAILARRFTAYAAKRLSGFLLTRLWSTLLHLVELTLLVELFTARPLVASLAFQNVALVVEAAFWGASEALRRRLRELGPSSPAAALTRRWLTGVTWVALACVVAPIAQGAWLARTHAGTSPVLVAYGIAVGLRIAIDLLLRTYYSGVFAHGRVYRPIATFLVGPLALLGTTWLGWRVVGPWSFPLAVVVATLLSRSLSFVYIRRAYRISRTPSPPLRLVLFPRASRSKHPVRGPVLRDVVLGAFANLGTRIGSVVLLAAVVPSLSKAAAGEDEEVRMLALSLHLAGPLFVVAASWASVFYHDWKRLEDEAAARLARAFGLRLVTVSLVVAACAWGAMVLVITSFVSWEAAEPVVVALVPATLGAAVWAAVQLRGFAHGAFLDQAASGVAMLVVVWLALSEDVLGEDGWSVAIAAGPWVAILVHVVLGRVSRVYAVKGKTTASLPVFLRLLRGTRGEVEVWEARARQQVGPVALRIARALEEAGAGACLRLGPRVLWFERVPAKGLAWWLARTGGLLDKAHRLGRGRGDELARTLASRRALDRGAEDAALDRLRAAHGIAFPEGFVLEVGARPPEAYLRLPAVVRQAVWRDAVRDLGGRRQHRSGYGVVPYAPDGAIRAVFAAPRPLDADATRSFRSAVEVESVRLRRGASASDVRRGDPT